MTSPAAPANATEHAPGFVKALTLTDATMLVAGSMIGSGIFIVSADIARATNGAGWLLLAWVVTGIMTLLGALARETTRVRLGTLVSPVIFRHPLLTAMAVSTLDHVSDGRAILGIGAGGVVEDMEGVGQGDVGAAELVGRLDEQVEIIDLLLRGVAEDYGSFSRRLLDVAWAQESIGRAGHKPPKRP